MIIIIRDIVNEINCKIQCKWSCRNKKYREFKFFIENRNWNLFVKERIVKRAKLVINALTVRDKLFQKHI